MRSFLFAVLSCVLAASQDAAPAAPTTKTSTTTQAPAPPPPAPPPPPPPTPPLTKSGRSEQGQYELDSELFQCDNVTKVQAAIKAGANLNARRGEENLQPLMVCIGWGWNPAHLPVVKALIDGKADLDQGDNRGRTPFWFAGHGGALDVIKLLHPLVKDHHAGDSYGENGLDFAARNGHHDAVELMIKLGVDPHRPDSRGGRTMGKVQDPRMHAIIKGEKHHAPPVAKAPAAHEGALPSKPKVGGEL